MTNNNNNNNEFMLDDLIVDFPNEDDIVLNDAFFHNVVGHEGDSCNSSVSGSDQPPFSDVELCLPKFALRSPYSTPQWRTGPMGPKTLCNACGVRYKSGRLVPEYRPANSPTYVPAKHSNSHRKVMEIRRQKELPYVGSGLWK
ncbi:GATA transcription factor 9 [Tanacetum coccineum]